MSQDDGLPSGDSPPRSDIYGDMAATVGFLREQEFYENQDEAHHVVPAQHPEYNDINIHPAVESALSSAGIEKLYRHQATAIKHIRAGDNAVVSTPTASGKTLCYAIPALEQALTTGAKTLYLAPQNALLQDQADTLQALANSLGGGRTATVRWYHSDLSTPAKRTIKRQVKPDITLMTPDLAHRSLLPWATHAANWHWLFAQLEQIVIDEIHTYRGVFGSEIALLFRRLNRLAEQFNQSPQFVCTSATIANPIDHAATITAQPSSSFALVDEDTSSRGERHWLLWNSPLTKEAKAQLRDQARKQEADAETTQEAASHTQGATGGERRSNHVQAKDLFATLVLSGYQVACFSNTRQNCEKYAQVSSRKVEAPIGDIETDEFPPLPDNNDPSLGDRIRPYHGSLPEAKRTAIETGLKTGAIRGVWSTSALGVGVDIGSLDVVILDGYPGSLMETFQWAGRAGRGDNECLVVVVGSDNPLDQRIMETPERLFDGDLEQAIVNPENDAIIDDHIVAAADELPVRPSDERFFGDPFPQVVTRLETAGRLTRELDGTVQWQATDQSPQYEMDLRNTGRHITLQTTTGDKIGELEFRAAMRDAHPNAIYRSDKTTYQVQTVNYEHDTAIVERYHDQQTEEYTQLLYTKTIDVTGTPDELRRRTLTFAGVDVPAAVGDVVVSRDIQGYNYYETHTAAPEQRTFETTLPEPETATTGILLEMPDRRELTLPPHVEQADGDDDDTDGFASGYLAALHAIEHALIGILPTAVLCDRRDIGGLSTEYHPVAEGPAIFVHDAYEGGAGLSRAAFTELDALLERTYEQITECSCADGCHSCVLSEHCGSANRELWKDGAASVLEQILYATA